MSEAHLGGSCHFEFRSFVVFVLFVCWVGFVEWFVVFFECGRRKNGD